MVSCASTDNGTLLLLDRAGGTPELANSSKYTYEALLLCWD